jgi:hypothetical protein
MTGSHKQAKYRGVHRVPGPRQIAIPKPLIVILSGSLMALAAAGASFSLAAILLSQGLADDSPQRTPSPSPGPSITRS